MISILILLWWNRHWYSCIPTCWNWHSHFQSFLWHDNANKSAENLVKIIMDTTCRALIRSITTFYFK